MWWIVFFLWTVSGKIQDAPAANQIIIFKENTKGPIGIMATSAGAPVDYTDAAITLNRRLIFNEYFMDSLTHVVRERIPERVVHAKGAGAFGYFEVTHDVTDICKAKLFSKVGKRTPVAVRFSPIVAERGGTDTTRDARGFAIKFYTEEGNFDILGSNAPMFAFPDPVLFSSFVRALKRNPATNLFDQNMFWDILTLNPESFHMFLLLFADRGIPRGYRYMPGFGIHTFQIVNENGVPFFVKFHFVPELGIRNMFSEEAREKAATDPDYATRDLYWAIGTGRYPAWKISLQVLTMEDVKLAGFNVFDVTRTLPLDKYPLHPVGRFVLNRNPLNYHAEIEQLAFNPANLVPGILGSPDKLFEARRLAYRDAQYYRLGANFNKIAVNCPMHPASLYTYNRDGVPPVRENGRGIPNYYPNSFNGPTHYIENNRVQLIEIRESPPNNFDQARELYTNELDREERTRMVENILFSIGPAAKFIQDRAVKIFNRIHPNLGFRIEQGLATRAGNGTRGHSPQYIY